MRELTKNSVELILKTRVKRVEFKELLADGCLEHQLKIKKIVGVYYQNKYSSNHKRTNDYTGT